MAQWGLRSPIPVPGKLTVPSLLSCERLHLLCLHLYTNTVLLSTWVLLPGMTTSQSRMTARRDPDGHGPAWWGEGGKMPFAQQAPFPITGTCPRATAPAKEAAFGGFSPCVLGCGKDWKHACWLQALPWGRVPLQRDKNHLSEGNSVARVRNNNASTLTLSHEAGAFPAGRGGRGKERAWGGGLLRGAGAFSASFCCSYISVLHSFLPLSLFRTNMPSFLKGCLGLTK